MESKSFEINLKNRKYIDDNLNDIKIKYLRKYILVFNQSIKKSFDTFEEASVFAVQKYGINTPFLIHYVDDIPDVNYVSLVFA